MGKLKGTQRVKPAAAPAKPGTKKPGTKKPKPKPAKE
jgi:hypothetical protein